MAAAERQSVLVVDDEPQILIALEDLLSDDYVVLKADSAERALHLVGTAPRLAVVVSDQRMPKMTGDQLLTELRQHTDAARVLLTGYADLSAIVRAVNDGQIFAYVSKPWDPHALKLTVYQAAEHSRLQRELERERKTFVDVLESVTDGIYFKDRDLRFQHVNHVYETLLSDWHIDVDRIGGRRLSEVWETPEAARAEAEERQVLDSEQGIGEVIRKVPFGDGFRWFSKSLALVRGPRSTAQGVVGVIRDVSERAETAQALAESAERQRLVLEAARAGLFDWDQTTEVAYFSEDFAALLGESALRLEPTFSALRARVHPDDAAALEAFMRPQQDEATRRTVDCRLRTADGSFRHFQMTAKALQSVRGVRLVGALQDVTEQKEQDERIASLSRVRAVLGEVNGAIVRVRDRSELLARSCEIAVRTGGLPLAVVCRCEASGLSSVVAAEGPDETLLELVRGSHLQQALRFEVGSMGLLTSGRAVLVDSIGLVTCGPLGEELVELGYQELAAFPLTIGGTLEFALVLATDRARYFDTQEMTLLQEVASNVALALEHEEKSRRLDLLLTHDELTGLSRRELFIDRLQQRIGACKPTEPHLAVLWLDINRFRLVNETLGRAGGDAVLQRLARELTRSVGDGDLVARVDPNAFAVISPPLKQESAAADFLSRVRSDVFDEPFEVGGTELRLSATIGGAMFPSDGTDGESLLFHAETAGKTARTNKQPYLFYAASMHERVAEKLAIETRLRRAIENEEFVLHYQPKVDLETGRVTGLEALVRWNDPEKGLIPPGAFIPILEETGLILEVGRWVLSAAVEQWTEWRRVGEHVPRIAVNVSAAQLAHDDFIPSVRRLMEAYEGRKPRLDLEITETVVMTDFDTNVKKLESLRSLGVEISLDDFGTGYSSLGYLRRLPTDVVKLDRSFVVSMAQSSADMSIVSTVITLAHSLGLRVVAEGVETQDHLHLLRLLRCDEIQGYFISKPLPAAEVVPFFERTIVFEGGKRAG